VKKANKILFTKYSMNRTLRIEELRWDNTIMGVNVIRTEDVDRVQLIQR
jgi:hypothetical protein